MSTDFAAVILAAGQGSRLAAAAPHGKAMALVAGRPLVDWVVDRLRQAGAAKLGIVLHPAASELRRHLRERYPDARLIEQPTRLGIADAASRALDAFPEERGLLLCACDSLFPTEDIRELVRESRGTHPTVGFLDMGLEATRTRSEIVVDSGRVLSLREKPAVPVSPLVALPLYWLPVTIGHFLASAPLVNGERHVTTALQAYLDNGGRVLSHEIGDRLEVTFPDDLVTVATALSPKIENATGIPSDAAKESP